MKNSKKGIERHRGMLPLLLAGCLAHTPTAQADSLPDPTRPPAEFARALAAASPASGASAPAPPVLQLLMTGKGVPPTAVVDGRTLGVGDSIGGLRITKISGSRIDYGSGPDRRRLLLIPQSAPQVSTDAGLSPSTSASAASISFSAAAKQPPDRDQQPSGRPTRLQLAELKP